MDINMTKAEIVMEKTAFPNKKLLATLVKNKYKGLGSTEEIVNTTRRLKRMIGIPIGVVDPALIKTISKQQKVYKQPIPDIWPHNIGTPGNDAVSEYNRVSASFRTGQTRGPEGH